MGSIGMLDVASMIVTAPRGEIEAEGCCWEEEGRMGGSPAADATFMLLLLLLATPWVAVPLPPPLLLLRVRGEEVACRTAVGARTHDPLPENDPPPPPRP